MLSERRKSAIEYKKRRGVVRSIMADTQGASTVEFALIVPVLITLIFAIFQFGMAFGDHLAITHAAREGARQAAVGQFNEEEIRARAYPVDLASITVSYPSGNIHGQPVQVRVEHNYQLYIPFFGTRIIPLTSQAQMRLEA